MGILDAFFILPAIDRIGDFCLIEVLTHCLGKYHGPRVFSYVIITWIVSKEMSEQHLGAHYIATLRRLWSYDGNIIHRKYRYLHRCSDYVDTELCFVVMTAVACVESYAHGHPPPPPPRPLRSRVTSSRSIYLFACTLSCSHYRIKPISFKYRSVLASAWSRLEFLVRRARTVAHISLVGWHQLKHHVRWKQSSLSVRGGAGSDARGPWWRMYGVRRARPSAGAASLPSCSR